MSTQAGAIDGVRSLVFTTPPAPRWAWWASHAVPVIALPSSLWRLALVVGLPVGYTEQVLRTDYDIPGSGYILIPLISLLQEGAALLTLGLVNDWGLVVPRWIPVIGGKPVPTRAAIIPAALGALVLCLLTFSQLLIWNQVADQDNLTGVHRTVMGWCYAPLLLWGPLLGLVSLSYWRRRRPE